MNIIRIIPGFSQANSLKAWGFFFFKQTRPTNCIRHKFTSFSYKPQVDKDVVLYEFEKPKFYLLANIFSAIQCAFWTDLGIFLHQRVLMSFNEQESKEKSFWKNILFEEKYVRILSVITIALGWIILIGTTFYTSRSIRKLILNKGGKTVTIVTYTYPGFNSSRTLPLSQVSSATHRSKAKKFLPIQIKGKMFYYLIDVSGKFINPQLFDYTAGIKRNI